MRSKPSPRSPLDAGVGVYSYADAARYIGSKPAELRRWLTGYQHQNRDGSKSTLPPLWQSQVERFEIDGIGFRDLIELRFVRIFRQCGVPLQLIRETIEEAKSELATEYPFTSETFRTDGRRIFLSRIHASGDTQLIDLCKRQNVIEKVIGPSLRSGIEFEMGGAARWFPLRHSKSIVFDPKLRFGQPILTEYGIPTVAIAEAVRAEGGDEAMVARLYHVSRTAVRNAIAFESAASGRA